MGEYWRKNHRKILLQAHFVFVTKYRKPILRDAIASDVKQRIFEIAKSRRWSIRAMETDRDHIHVLLDYDATESVASIVKILKQETTFFLWCHHRTVLSACCWAKDIFWSRGYFACSVGNVSEDTIRRYIEAQG